MATPEDKTRVIEFLKAQWTRRAPCHCPTGDSKELTLKAITSGKWRRSALDAYSRDDTAEKIERTIAHREDLEFSVPFGGYKLLHAASYPHLNWAEVFAVNYLRRFAEAVANGFSGNVLISFSYCSRVMDLVNNMKLSEQEVYIDEFERLLELFSYDRVNMRLVDIATFFSGEDVLRAQVLSSAAELERTWNTLPTELQEKRYKSAARNMHILGDEDLSDLSGRELEEHITRSAIRCEALDRLAPRRDFNKFSSRIQLVHVRGPVPAIHIASCDTSANHFGVGTGVVDVRKDRCLQRIMTLEQLGATGPCHVEVLPLAGEVSRGFPGLNEAPFELR